MTNPLNLLLIEDSDSDAVRIIHLLKHAGYEVEYQRVETADEMKIALSDKNWDIIISDNNLPFFDASRALSILNGSNWDIPFIIVSGAIGEDLAVTLMKAGAQDYIMKSNLQRLAPAVERELGEAITRRKKRDAEIALRESEERYRVVAESAVEAFITFDSNGLIVAWNHGASRIFGYTEEEIIGQIVNLLFPSYRDGTNSFKLSRIKNGENEDLVDEILELHGLHKDGKIFPLEMSLANWETNKGMFFTAIIRDVTKRNQVEMQNQKRLKQLAALHAIETAIASSRNLDQALEILLDQVISSLGINCADILIFNPKTQMLEFSRGQGLHPDALQHTRLKLGQGYAGKAALEGQIIYIPDLNKNGGDLHNALCAKNEKIVSYYGIPLIANGHIKGVLELLHRDRFEPEEDLQTFMMTLASQAAIAIDNLELFVGLERSNEELAAAYDATLEGWSRALELRERETAGHSHRVVDLTLRLGKELGFSDEDMVHLRRGALLHDIGKMGIPDSILLKPGSLTDEERTLMNFHPIYAKQLLEGIAYLEPALEIPYSHHEKWDGTGYPQGLIGEQIPPSARLFAVIDVWDALCSDRPYRKAWSEQKALEYISQQAGSQFDPKVVGAFLRLVENRKVYTYFTDSRIKGR